MSLTIDDQEADRLERAVAAATGETVAEAVRSSLQRRLDEIESNREREAVLAAMRDIGRTCAAHMKPPFSATDHGDRLYGPDGLPE